MQFNFTFVLALISFLCFIVIMNKIFYAPLLKIKKEREAFVEDNYKIAESLYNTNIKVDGTKLIIGKNAEINGDALILEKI